MIGRRGITRVAVLGALTIACLGGPVSSASALNLKPVCGVAGLVSGLVGKACSVVQNGGRVLGAGKKLLGGHVGQAVKTILGDSKVSAAAATRVIGFASIGAWVLGGAGFALHETARVLGESTSPQLRSTWFSATYWRMVAISAVLTLPFLFAAAVQAILRSDLALLVKAAFGYLPLAMLAVSIAAPLTMLLLATADELSRVVSSAAGDAAGHFLGRAAAAIGGTTLMATSPFLAFLIGVFTVAGALVLWIELLVREVAVYVIVLMLPLAFAALVWPARRVWAMRAVEVLVALILSKFAIVAVLSLGGAAMSASLGQHSVSAWLAGLVLLVMGAFTPWALLRLIPLAELAAGAAGTLRDDATRALRRPVEEARAAGHAGDDWATSTTAQMRREVGVAPAQSAPAQSASAPADSTGRAALAGGVGDAGAAAGGPAPIGVLEGPGNTGFLAAEELLATGAPWASAVCAPSDPLHRQRRHPVVRVKLVHVVQPAVAPRPGAAP